MDSFKVGELAKKSGVSVRTLHHYDKIGLLSPSGKSMSGYRLYKKSDLFQLQQILSLKDMGFTLTQISDILCGKNLNLKKVLRIHVDKNQKKIEVLKKINQTLSYALNSLTQEKSLTTDELLHLMNEVKKMEKFEKYYTKEQMEVLQDRMETYPEEVKRVEQEWQILFEQFSQAFREGKDPACKEVQEMAAKAQHFINLFTGGDKGIEEGLDRSYEDQKNDACQNWGVDPDVFDYASKARKIFNENG